MSSHGDVVPPTGLYVVLLRCGAGSVGVDGWSAGLVRKFVGGPRGSEDGTANGYDTSSTGMDGVHMPVHGFLRGTCFCEEGWSIVNKNSFVPSAGYGEGLG